MIERRVPPSLRLLACLLLTFVLSGRVAETGEQLRPASKRAVAVLNVAAERPAPKRLPAPVLSLALPACADAVLPVPRIVRVADEAPAARGPYRAALAPRPDLPRGPPPVA